MSKNQNCLKKNQNSGYLISNSMKILLHAMEHLLKDFLEYEVHLSPELKDRIFHVSVITDHILLEPPACSQHLVL